MVSHGGLRLFFLLHTALADRTAGTGIFGLCRGGADGAAGGEKGVGCCGNKRTAGGFSGSGIHLCLCVYVGRLYAGPFTGGTGGAFYKKTPAGLSGRSGLPGFQSGNLSRISFLCHDFVSGGSASAFCGLRKLQGKAEKGLLLSVHGNSGRGIVLRAVAAFAENSGKGAGWLSGNRWDGLRRCCKDIGAFAHGGGDVSGLFCIYPEGKRAL